MGQWSQVFMLNDSRDRAGIIGWALLASVVVIFDAWALTAKRQTMSAAFLEATRKPVCREVLAIMWGALTWHLFGGRPAPWRKLVG